MNTRHLMNTRYVWIEIVLLGAAVALVLAILLAALGATAGVASGQSQADKASPQSFEGMISCSRCGAKHQPALDRSASNCVRVCVHGGASFALIDGESVYRLEGDPGSIKRVAGQRARVIGTRNGNLIRVASISSSS